MRPDRVDEFAELIVICLIVRAWAVERVAGDVGDGQSGLTKAGDVGPRFRRRNGCRRRNLLQPESQASRRSEIGNLLGRQGGEIDALAHQLSPRRKRRLSHSPPASHWRDGALHRYCPPQHFESEFEEVLPSLQGDTVLRVLNDGDPPSADALVCSL